MINNVLSASRMTCAMRCLRQHFYNCEIGLRKTTTGVALRLGSAWARAMEVRWEGADYDGALVSAIPEWVDLDEYSCATVAALLAGYYDYYGPIEEMGKMHPEQQFGYELGHGFTAEGKLDTLGTLADGRSGIIEGKTTRDSLRPDSDYWLRLSFNMQLYQYTLAARREGWDIAVVLYDVTRKPSIKPKEVNNLDSEGRKIVLDQKGQRVFLKNGEPKQGGDTKKGHSIKSHVESPDEFSDRLWRDTLARPDFYFVRREVPVIDEQLESFERQRLAIAKLILALRENERSFGSESWEDERDPEAWPRNVSRETCGFCQYKEFCLQNIQVTQQNIPAGFEVQPFNPELKENEPTTSEEDGAATAESV